MISKQYRSNLWVLENPVIVARILKGFFRALLLNKNTLKTIELYPTFECNSNCLMCSVSKFKQRNIQTLTIQQYENIAAQGVKMGAIAMTLLGGEPLMAKDLFPIIKIFRDKKYFVSMVSNSMLINEVLAESLVDSGLNSIYFSLESVNEKENDAIRGIPGHYRSVMKAINLCKKQGLLVGIAGVIAPGGLDNYIKILEFCKSNDLLASGGELAAVGAAEKSELVSDKEHLEIKKLLSTYSKLTFDWGLSYFLKCRCPAGKEKIGITCYGDVIGCSLNPISFGNVKKEALKIIWKRMGNFTQFKKNSDECISARDIEFIQNFIEPVHHQLKNPIYYKEHPQINSKTEPDLFK